MKKLLPIGIQTFSNLIEDGYLYVDKTQHIFRLLEGQYYFLSRPRRFGKSLLISTLKELFEGNKDLFKGLWIYDKIQWQQRPVIHLEFGSISSSQTSLPEAIDYTLDQIAHEHQITLPDVTYDLKFQALIQSLGKEKKVAILIDEYDKPIVDFIDDPKQAEANRRILQDFYSVVKGSGEYISFFFITGVSKFTKVSIFSALNNLEDISYDQNFGTLTGYTQSELEDYFAEFIKDLKVEYHEVFPDILATIKRWYNGYSWDGKNFVYNPFSILNLMKKRQFMDYWFATGTPNFLIQLFKDRHYNSIDLAERHLHHSDLHSFDFETLDLPILLLQTGYLTIKEHDIKNQIYTLGFPNKEVESSFSRRLLAVTVPKNSRYHTQMLLGITRSLESGNIDEFISFLTTLFAGIAYPVNVNTSDSLLEKERYFHSIFYTILKLIGTDIEPEVLTFNGRIDALIQTKDSIYIVEFKVGSASTALQQIKAKEYHLKFNHLNKKIVLLGIGFDAEKKNISRYEVATV